MALKNCFCRSDAIFHFQLNVVYVEICSLIWTLIILGVFPGNEENFARKTETPQPCKFDYSTGLCCVRSNDGRSDISAKLPNVNFCIVTAMAIKYVINN